MVSKFETWARPLEEQRAALRALLSKGKLTAPHSAAIESLCRVAIGFAPVKLDRGEPALGGSRIGGDPDLAPDDAEWPESHSFLLQVNLGDLAEHDVDGALPKAGLLSFFVVDGEDEDGDYLGTGHVQFTDVEPSRLLRVKAPSVEGIERYAARGMHFASVLTLPSPECDDLAELDLSEAEATAYNDRVFNAFPRAPHVLLGRDNTDYHDAEAEDERLLLSLDTVESIGWIWGDDNRLSFYLGKRDLKRRKFGEAYPEYIDA